jgi:hypothetical protein
LIPSLCNCAVIAASTCTCSVISGMKLPHSIWSWHADGPPGGLDVEPGLAFTPAVAGEPEDGLIGVPLCGWLMVQVVGTKDR